jgi:hypothetical protein
MIILNWSILILIAITASGMLFSRDWRWSLGLLALQYVGVFWMIQNHWPVSMAAAKLVTGWMACAVLGIALLNTKAGGEKDNIWTQGRLFHASAAAMVLVATFALSLRAVGWLKMSLPVAWGGLILIGLGLLHLGITSNPFQVIVGLLTVFAGFEVIYASVETSALVTTLLALANLGLALAGAYFIVSSRGKAS